MSFNTGESVLQHDFHSDFDWEGSEFKGMQNTPRRWNCFRFTLALTGETAGAAHTEPPFLLFSLCTLN